MTIHNNLRELPYGIQAIFVRDRIEHSKSFAFSQCGGKRAARKDAAAWLECHSSRTVEKFDDDRWYKTCGRGEIDRVGVSKTIKHRHGYEYGVFQVFYIRDDGARRYKCFYYGRMDKLDETRRRSAMIRAIGFRDRYEKSIQDGKSFE